MCADTCADLDGTSYKVIWKTKIPLKIKKIYVVSYAGCRYCVIGKETKIVPYALKKKP